MTMSICVVYFVVVIVTRVIVLGIDVLWLLSKCYPVLHHKTRPPPSKPATTIIDSIKTGQKYGPCSSKAVEPGVIM